MESLISPNPRTRSRLNSEGLNNKIRVLRRRAYGSRDEEFLRLKVLASMLAVILSSRVFTHTIPGSPFDLKLFTRHCTRGS